MQGKTPIVIKVYMMVRRGYEMDKFALSLKIAGNRCKLSNNSTNIAASEQWVPAYVFGSAGNHQSCTISTINVDNGDGSRDDRTLEIGPNEIVDHATGTTDTERHGDCSQLELGIHMSGGYLKPPVAQLAGKFWTSSSSSDSSDDEDNNDNYRLNKNKLYKNFAVFLGNQWSRCNFWNWIEERFNWNYMLRLDPPSIVDGTHVVRPIKSG